MTGRPLFEQRHATAIRVVQVPLGGMVGAIVAGPLGAAIGVGAILLAHAIDYGVHFARLGWKHRKDQP